MPFTKNPHAVADQSGITYGNIGAEYNGGATYWLAGDVSVAPYVTAFFPSEVLGISSDGNVLGGFADDAFQMAMIWTVSPQTESILAIPSPFTDAQVNSVSPSGFYACGTMTDSGSGISHAFQWNLQSGVIDLGVLAGDTNSFGLSVSDLGDVAGYGDSHALLWQNQAVKPPYILKPIPQMLSMPCITPCLGTGSPLTKV